MLEHGRPGETYHINGDAELTNLELTGRAAGVLRRGMGHGHPRA